MALAQRCANEKGQRGHTGLFVHQLVEMARLNAELAELPKAE